MCDTCYKCTKKKLQDIFPVHINNSDGSVTNGVIEFNSSVATDAFQQVKNKFITKSFDPGMRVYLNTQKIINDSQDAQNNIYLIIFIGLWVLITILLLLTFGSMHYGHQLYWFIPAILIVIIIPIIMIACMLWISANIKGEINGYLCSLKKDIACISNAVEPSVCSFGDVDQKHKCKLCK